MSDDFATLLTEALADPEHADFQRLRESFASSDFYMPYGRDQEDIEELHMRIATKRWDKALALVEEMLDFDPLGISLRFAYAHVLEGVGEDWEATSQRCFANGLMRAILGSGDGRTAETAIAVLDMRELRLVLDVLGCRAVRSQLTHGDGRWLDVVEATDAHGEERTLYFDVDLPQGWLASLQD